MADHKAGSKDSNNGGIKNCCGKCSKNCTIISVVTTCPVILYFIDQTTNNIVCEKFIPAGGGTVCQPTGTTIFYSVLTGAITPVGTVITITCPVATTALAHTSIKASSSPPALSLKLRNSKIK